MTTPFICGRAFLVYHDGSRKLLQRINDFEDLIDFMDRTRSKRYSTRLYRGVGIDWFLYGELKTQHEEISTKKWNKGKRWKRVGALVRQSEARIRVTLLLYGVQS